MNDRSASGQCRIRSAVHASPRRRYQECTSGDIVISFIYGGAPISSISQLAMHAPRLKHSLALFARVNNRMKIVA